jgi:5-methylcytosine-specific restriction endonuclease McrA
MPDPYSPKLSSFKYTATERRAISWALKQKKPWMVDKLKKRDLTSQELTYVKAIVRFKNRVKEFHAKRQNNRCCYCGQSLFNRTIEQDREHIIPKAKKKSLIFAVFNLAVACKTCNMSIKKSQTSHLRGFRRSGLRDPKVILNSTNYNIPHPNIHDWEEHMDYSSSSKGRATVTHYQPKTKRGRFAYYFFKLDDQEEFANTEEQRKIRGAQPLHPRLVELRDTYKQ